MVWHLRFWKSESFSLLDDRVRDERRPAAVMGRDFDTLAKWILRRGKEAGDLRPCPDHYVGMIDSFVPGSDFPERSEPSKRRAGPCFLMVLESPHRSEFGRKRNGVWIARDPGPACGATGKAITRHISNVLDFVEYPNYGLVLINAVQYQCSRGQSPLNEKVRDENFVSIWNESGCENFMERLSTTHRVGDVIVNSCTKGKSKEAGELRELVQKAIDLAKLKGRTRTLRSTHPASWGRSGKPKPAYFSHHN